MCTKILINRDTIRVNPDYGNQFYTVTGRPTYTLEVRGLSAHVDIQELTGALQALGWILETYDRGVATFISRGIDTEDYTNFISSMRARLEPYRVSYTTGVSQEVTTIQQNGGSPRFIYEYHREKRTCPICQTDIDIPGDLEDGCMFCYNCDCPVGDEEFEVEHLTTAELEALATQNERT
jgi:hypothetical protein